MKKILILTILMLFAFSLKAFTAENSFKAELSSGTIPPGRQVELVLYFTQGKNTPVPEMPFLPGISFKYKGKEYIEGKDLLLHKFSVVASRSGSFTIGPIYVLYEGELLSSNRVILKVDKKYDNDAVVSNASIKEEEDLSDHIFIKVKTEDTDIFINQEAIIKLYVYSDWLDVVDLTIIEPPTKQELISTNFKKTGSSFYEKNNIKYFIIEYEKTVFSPFPGEFTIEPFEVRFKILMPKKNEKDHDMLNDNRGFYEGYLGRKREKREVIKGEHIVVKVKALPEDMPEGFNGAVGDFDVDITEDVSRFDDNNEFKFETHISGKGNYNTVKQPNLISKKGIIIYPALTKKGEDNVVFQQGFKVLDHAEADKLGIRFVYFSPSEEKYKVVEKEIGVETVEGEKEDEKSINVSKKVKQEWIMSLKEQFEPVFFSTYGMFSVFFIAAVFFLMILIFLVGIYGYRIYWIKNSASPKAVYLRCRKRAQLFLSAAKLLCRKGRSEDFCDMVFKGAQEYFGVMLGKSSVIITESTITGFMQEKFQLNKLSPVINEVFSFCYIGKYSTTPFNKMEMKEMLKKTEELIQVFNKIGLEIIEARMNNGKA